MMGAPAAALVQALDLGGDVEIALSAQEEAVRRPQPSAHRANELVQRRVRRARGEVEVARATLGVEAPGHRQRLDERRFARAVLTDEEGDLGMQLEPVEPAQHG